jgi:nucleotide-binding universal stress UspA family protein
VHVVHAVEWPKAAPISYSYAEGPEATRGIMVLRDEMHRAADTLVADIAERLRAAGFRTTTEVREGDARHVVLDCAGDWHADLIVLGSHGRRGINRFLLGSVSESVVRHAACSVLIVRDAKLLTP